MAENFQLQSAYSQPGYAPQLQLGTNDNQMIMDLFRNKQDQSSSDIGDFSKKEITREAMKSGSAAGAAGGGLGGMLTSGGLSAGLMGAGPVGWGVMGGGMLISAIEQKKAEKAAAEKAKIDAEMQKRNNLITLAREAAGNDFRLV